MVVDNSVSHRINLIIEHFGKNKTSFSTSIGLTNNVTIGRIINENRSPSFEILQKIATAYPQINFNWLLTGQGEMFTSLEDDNEAQEVSTNYLEVPLIPIQAQAGLLTGYGDMQYWDGLAKEIWEVDKEYKGRYVVFEVKGDSMDDNTVKAILEGDRLLCREIQKQYWKNKLHIHKWNFVIVHATNGVIVKRIVDHNTETGDVLCHSLNDFYEDFIINLKDVLAIYNVVDLKRSLRL